MNRRKRPRTWKILEWLDGPSEVAFHLPLQCECGYEAECPAGKLDDGLIIAVFGMRIVFDPPGLIPPKNFMPDAIECRKCGRIYVDKTMPEDRQGAIMEGTNVR